MTDSILIVRLWGRFARLAITALLLSLPLLGDSTATQASPRYSRNSSIPAPVLQSGQGNSSSREQGTNVKDTPVHFDTYLDIQRKTQRVSEAIVRKHIELVNSTETNSPDMPDYLFRLAESHAHNQRYWRFRAMDLHSNIDTSDKHQKGKLIVTQAKFFKRASLARNKSLRIYQRLTTTPGYANYPRMHEVLFHLAHSLELAKRIPESRKSYRKLITDYPTSKYVPQAYMSFANYFFENDDLQNAEKFYDKVLKFPHTTIYSLAQYKQGWVYFNQDRAIEALELFFTVAKSTKTKKHAKSLYKAARRDFVRVYANVGKTDKAYAAFRRVDQAYAFTMLERLGSIYLDQGKGANAVVIFRQLISRKPRNISVCEWQGNILNAVLSSGSQQHKRTELSRLAEVYTIHKSKKILTGKSLRSCRQRTQTSVRNMAKTWHREAMITKNKNYQLSAKQMYAVYLRTFPRSKDIGQMQYHYADILWHEAADEKSPRKASIRWEESARAFTKAIQSGQLSGDTLKEAAYAPVLAWKNALDVVPRPKPPATTKIRTQTNAIPVPRVIDRRSLEMIKAFDVYTNLIEADDPEIISMRFHGANILWRFDHLKKAIPLFSDIVDNHPSHEMSETSARIVVNSLSRLQKHRALARFAESALLNRELLSGRPELEKELIRVHIIALRFATESLQARGKFLACGREYMNIYHKYPKAKNMDEVLYNAGICFQKAKALGLSIRSFSRLGALFPKSSRTKKSLILMGAAYSSIADYQHAAEFYEEYAARFPEAKDAPDALNNAVTYRKGIGQSKKAVNNINAFVRKYKKRRKKDSAAALLGLAGIFESGGDTASELKTYKRYLREVGGSAGFDRALIANGRIGAILWKQSCPVAAHNGSCVTIVRDKATRNTRTSRRRSSLPLQCGDSSKIRLTLVPRNPHMAKEAQSYFKRVASLTQNTEFAKIPQDRMATAQYWASASRFYANELHYEKFLSLGFPSNLNFSPRFPKAAEKSTQVFRTWIERKSGLLKKVQNEYMKIKDIGGAGPVWALASAARVAQLSQNFSDNLFTAPIPASLRTGAFAEEKVTAYCDEITNETIPLEEASIRAYGFCLKLSTKLSWFNQWSRMCERELGQIRPMEYPTATEMHGVAKDGAPIIDRQGLIRILSLAEKPIPRANGSE